MIQADEDDPLISQCQSRLGTLLGGKWRLEFLIGVGGMAAVYAGTHRNGARAAIKVLHPEFAGHEEVRSRFLREAYIANKVGHPGTVQVLDDDIGDNGEPYIVMELLVGDSVENRAQRNGGWLPFADTMSIAEQTLAVLEAAHAQGIVHRDLKPDNLFLSNSGQLKLLDFGIARLHEGGGGHQRTQTGMMMGTPAYMAPEQALGRWEKVDGRTDLWAVGAIIFSLLSGRAVHAAKTDNEMLIMAATRPAPSLGRVLPQAPFAVVQLVDKALHFDIEKRFANATQMRAAVQALVPAGAISAAPTRAPGRAAPTAAQVTGAAPQPTVARSAAPPGVSAVRAASQALAAPSATPTVARGAAPVTGTAAAPNGEVVPEAPPRGTAFGPRPDPGGADASRRRAEVMSVQSVDYMSATDLAGLKDLFSEIEKALVARVQYRKDHPETRRREERAFTLLASALMTAEAGLAWSLTPYSFVAGEETLWEPSQPFDRIPYQLFSDGVRMFSLHEGIDQQEFFAWLRLLTLDRATEVAPEDDFVTLLWEANFEHIAYSAVDSFAEGDQASRVAFERQREAVIEQATSDTSEAMQQAWQAHRATHVVADMGTKQRQLMHYLSTGEAIDTEAAARAAALGGRGRSKEMPLDPGAVRLDGAARRMLQARLAMDTAGLSQRFVFAVARAYDDEADRGGGSVVSAQLAFAIDGLSQINPGMAIELVGGFCRTVAQGLVAGEAEARRARLAGEIVSATMLQRVLEGALEAGETRAVYLEGLQTILGYVDATHFDAVLQVLPKIEDTALSDLVVRYLARTGRGREPALGALFKEAGLELGLALVRVLAGIDTPGAKEAIAEAARSPHPVVRIEALGHTEGVSSDRLRMEIRGLIEDREPGVRLAALQAMAEHSIRVAGPFLVLRVKSETFDGLSVDERRQALNTLAVLAPSRAEAVAVDILKDARLVTSDAHEQSRELGAELLGRMGRSQQVLELLGEVSKARWKNSERARNAATRALAEFERRAQSPPAGGKTLARKAAS